jgi:hypothetical protein
MKHSILGLFVALTMITMAAQGAAETGLGIFHAWEAYTFPVRGKTACAIWASATKSEGKYKKRGDVVMFVSHRPWTRQKRVHEVSFETGYTFKSDSEVTIAIDKKKKFTLFTKANTAWSRTAADDAALVKAMRIGKVMVIRGQSSRGTKTKDTFELFGFTAAHNAINKACGVK